MKNYGCTQKLQKSIEAFIQVYMNSPPFAFTNGQGVSFSVGFAASSLDSKHWVKRDEKYLFEERLNPELDSYLLTN